MKKTTKEIVSYLQQTLFLLIVAVFIVFMGEEGKKEKNRQENQSVNVEDKIKTFDLWYTDKVYEPYFAEMAERYEEETGVKVNLKSCTVIDYFHEISAASADGFGPDLYLMAEENLQTAVLLGIAEQNTDKIIGEDNYYSKAIKSITYGDKLYGYPMGYDTCLFASNTLYTDVVPSTFDEIKTFAKSFNVEDENGMYAKVTSVLKWDISDIMYNYPFVGDSINIGGECRDNMDIVDVCNTKAVYALDYYNSLSDYFSIDIDETTYDNVVKEIVSGEIMYSIVSADIIKTLENAENNTIELSIIPDMTENFETRPLSMTDIIMVNPFGDMKEEAYDFARYVSYEHSEEMYGYTGNIGTKKWIYENLDMNLFGQAYEKSVGLPKFMTTSDFWLVLSNMFKDVWNGESDAFTELYNMQSELMERIN